MREMALNLHENTKNVHRFFFVYFIPFMRNLISLQVQKKIYMSETIDIACSRARLVPVFFFLIRWKQIDSTAGGFCAASISATVQNLFVLDYDSKLNPYFMYEVDPSSAELDDGRFVRSRINHFQSERMRRRTIRFFQTTPTSIKKKKLIWEMRQSRSTHAHILLPPTYLSCITE